MPADLTVGIPPSAVVSQALKTLRPTAHLAADMGSERSDQSDDRLIDSTTSLCAECRQRVEARIIVRAGAAYLLKRCPNHGEQLALLEKNARYYLARLAYDKPGTASKTQTQTRRGCPFDCGLCPNHQQHTCIGVIEITDQCNLDCPECYAKPRTFGTLSLEQVARMMDFFQDAESGKAEVLQISGGEPTLHPRILDILRLAKAKGFKCVMLNTNGLRLRGGGILRSRAGRTGRRVRGVSAIRRL